jgi:hypothetical protein
MLKDNDVSGARRVALDFHAVDPLDLLGRNRSRPPAWGGGGARGSPSHPKLSIMIMRLPQRDIAGEGRRCRDICDLMLRRRVDCRAPRALKQKESWRVKAARADCGLETARHPAAIDPDAAPRHQARSSPSSCGDSMGWRSLRRLPCSTRRSMRSESTSLTLSAMTSETRSPAP